MTSKKTNLDQWKSKNDIAWEALFERYPILDTINQQGYFEIEAAKINQERESRLMAKFDHSVNLPQIFKEHHLSILSISRSKYIIGHFDSYSKIEYNDDLEPIPIDFPPNIETIDYTHLYSEASAIICAYNTGIIDGLIFGEQPKLTLFGRMSSSQFDFKINNLLKDTPYSISVNNAQCEIDAGFESDNCLILIEAKNYKVDDFLVRQLYYPYRLWSNKINKKVVPVLMTYFNDVFSFFIYEFKDDLDYNSIQLIEQQDYIIAPEKIEESDVSNLYSNLKLVPETKVPFPQANDFNKVVELLTLLVNKNLTKDEITENYQFDKRQTNYYTAAGRYLGLIDKYTVNKKEITFCLTDEGKSILGKRHKIKYLLLIQKILEHEPFYKAFELTLSLGDIPSTKQIEQAIAKVRSDLGSSTINRRSSTVKRWIEWIWNQISKD